MLQSVILKDLYKEMNLFKILQLLFFIEVQPAKRHWESTSTAKQLSHKINKDPLLLQNNNIRSVKLINNVIDYLF